MDQKPAELLEEIHRLMQLKGENPFKVRAYEKAIQAIEGRSDLVERAKAGTLTELPGIGKGISDVLTEYLVGGKSSLRDELLASLPQGLLELSEVPGLGPKKAMQLIEELGIHSLGELEYACRENRLLRLKGFGEKLQKKVLEGIVFLKAGRGQRRLDEAFAMAEGALKSLLAVSGGRRVAETGALRRRRETLSELDFLLEEPAAGVAEFRARAEGAVAGIRLPVRLHFAAAPRFGYELARTTATEEHWTALGAPAPFDAVNEEELFEKLGLAFIPPESRETGEEVKLARAGKLDGLLPWDGVRGIFHNHTTRSDGVDSLAAMVREAEREGYHYIGISDHSQSAYYAQGLKIPDLLEQEKEIRDLQEKHPKIRIFWGIESDILADGSLDYDAQILKKFDFVIASIHSRFNADRETMTQRILEAIRNPCTRFLGHVTGRLLLARSGYEVDMEKIIETAARHDVAIEFNSNPARLDIDWRWGAELRKCRTKVSINPDAHATSEIAHTRYGVAMARKALMPVDQVVNAWSVKEVERWLQRK